MIYALQTLADGRISLQSEDETARLVLHPHGRRFAVCFPLLVGKMTDENGAVTFHFMWQTQVFATADCPARWTYPLNMAIHALQRQRGSSSRDQICPSGKFNLVWANELVHL